MSLEFTESFSVFNEPITRKLGWINFGFGLDTQPARSLVLVLFIVNYLVCMRSRVTNMTRSFEDLQGVRDQALSTQPIRSGSGGVSRVFYIPGPTPNLV